MTIVPAGRSRLDLNDVRLLLAVIDHGGFTPASRATGVAKSTLSQRVAALEKSLGMPLLRRTPRSLSLTGAGKLVVAHAREIEALARRAEQDLRGLDVTVCGTLRVTCSVALAQFALGRVTPQFLAAHPGISLQIHSTNRFVDLVAEDCDLALRSHGLPLQDSMLIQRVIGRLPWILTASPTYLAGDVVRAPADLSGLDLLYFGPPGTISAWTLRNADQKADVPVHPRLWSEDMRLLRRACIEGAGVAALPAYIVADAINDGRLDRVLPDWLAGEALLSLILPPRGQGSHAGRMFGEHLVSTLPAILDSGVRILERSKT